MLQFLAEANIVLPDWVPPSVLVIIGLAALVSWLNYKGVWISGREHQTTLDAIIAEKDKQIEYIEARREEERKARLEDAASFSQVTSQLRAATENFQDVERLLGARDDPAEALYEERIGTKSGSRIRNSPSRSKPSNRSVSSDE